MGRVGAHVLPHELIVFVVAAADAGRARCRRKAIAPVEDVGQPEAAQRVAFLVGSKGHLPLLMVLRQTSSSSILGIIP